jgi:hypothetical protein
VGPKYDGALSTLGNSITSLGGTAAIQEGGDFAEETGAQSVLRLFLEVGAFFALGFWGGGELARLL